MARMARAELFAPDEVAVVHVTPMTWGHCADLKICCDFAQIIPVSGFDHI